jgi:hypothetical protein
MKSKNVKIWLIAIANMLALLGPLAGQSRGDFILYGDEQLTVNSSHYQGTLYDWSRASIISGGYVNTLYAYDSSTMDISGGSVSNPDAWNSSTANISGGSVNNLRAWNSSAVNITGGTVYYLTAYNSNTVDISGGSIDYILQVMHNSLVSISGGSVTYINAIDSSVVNISGGSVNSYLYAYEYSVVNISGGFIANLKVWNSSEVDISGGQVDNLCACDSSLVTFHGRDFLASDGLFLYGDRVLGTGLLSGEWMDGTPWAMSIGYHDPTATIWAIPEPATLFLLGLGAVMLRRKKC